MSRVANADGRARWARVILRDVRLDDRSIPAYLERIGLKAPHEPADVIGAGDGNINFVRRVRVGERSLVIKQARPSLERFPEYTVTTERIVFEQRYGEVVSDLAPEVANVLPEPLHFDPESRVLVMEDLGDGPRLDTELVAARVPLTALRTLGGFLGAVHCVTRPRAEQLAPRFGNDEMRALHGEHIFTLPYEPNEFPISQGLRAEAHKRLASDSVRTRLRELRARYYDSREGLVHGDVQAGNVLLQDDRPRLLDAEIAHVGDPAFDLGTALAHLLVHAPLRSGAYREGAEALLEGYRRAGGRSQDASRARAYAGVEIMRRSIGAARLGFLADDEAATQALDRGVELLLSESAPSG